MIALETENTKSRFTFKSYTLHTLCAATQHFSRPQTQRLEEKRNFRPSKRIKLCMLDSSFTSKDHGIQSPCPRY